MSTDITLEATTDSSTTDFDDYARLGVVPVAKAIAIAIDDHATTTVALTSALRSVQQRWHEAGVSNDPDPHVFGAAIEHIVTGRAEQAQAREVGSEPIPLRPLLGPACAVAYFGLDWPIDLIATTLQLSPEAVDAHLEHARTAGFVHAEPSPLAPSVDVRTQIDALLAQAEPTLPNARRIARRNRWAARRSTLRTGAIVGALLIGGVVLLAQLVARPDRIADEASPPVAATGAPAAGASPNANPAAGEIGNEPRPDLVPTPQLITTDGAGGFVGVRSAPPHDPRVVFTRSKNGESWSLASVWNLGPQTEITRFERSGQYYMSWIDGVRTSSDGVIGTVGISRDLVAWTVVELALNDEPANGLAFDAHIADISVSGNNILALVTTTVEIDFPALLLSEGYTCGRSDTAEQASPVSLCNVSDLDVLSLSNIATLPERNRLFVSRDGLPFEQTEVPFGNQTAAHLTSVNGAFAVTDETGVRFATSRDALTWRTVAAGKPPFPVRAAATDESNQVVGVGVRGNDRVVLFHNDGQSATTTVIDVASLVGEVNPASQAVVAAGPDLWVVYLFEPHTRAWLLTSRDGRTWAATATSPPTGDSPLLLVGDNEALVQWVGSDRATITLGVPLQ